MTTPLQNPMSDLLKVATIYRFARLYKLTREDGVIFRFTDHNAPLIKSGYTWTPAGGVNTSATRNSHQAEAASSELLGVLTSEAIKHDDLRAGLFENCEVKVTTVDWKYPWRGSFKVQLFHIGGIEFSEDQWFADLQGMGGLLLQTKGRVITRGCTHDLGDDMCKVHLGPLTVIGSTVNAIIGSYNRLRFTCDLSADFGENLLFDKDNNRINDGWFNDGELVWTSGSNENQTFRIRKFVEPSGAGNDGVVWLFSPTQFDIQNNDSFTAIPGCNKLGGKTTSHCKKKFKEEGGSPNNFINFGGFPDMPGNIKLRKTPAIKA